MESFRDIDKSALHDWVESETHALDVTASWETLCDAYRILEFVDPISDAMKMEEFKWIIGEMNKHLTRARKKLLSCQDMEATRKALEEMYFTNNVSVTSRKSLAYNKLRQRWINQMIVKLNAAMETMEENQSGQSDY